MKKEYLILALFALFVWSSKDKIPAEFQFWKQNATQIKVENNSDQDVSNVSVVVWSVPHTLGTIRKGNAQELKIGRKRDVTDVVIRFRYGNEMVERFAGTLDEENQYRMLITISYAGVVFVRAGSDMPEAAATSQ
jgi:hypothetical protein